MRVYGLVSAVLLAGLLAAIGAFFIITARYAPGMTPMVTFLEATPTLKLSMIACLLLAIVAIVVTVIGAAAAPRSRDLEIVLGVTSAAAVAFGLLGALYGEMITQIVLAKTGPASFGVTAPGRAEALLCVSLGLLGAFLGTAGVALLRARWRSAQTPDG